MLLEVKRIAKRDTYTISKWYIDGKYVCDGVEDTDRGLKQEMSVAQLQTLKMYGKTAIPAGTYTIKLTYSPRLATKRYAAKYEGCLPEVCDVKAYSGVRLHPGNTAEDTLGCLLPGYNKVKGKVVQSTECFYNIMDNYLLPAWRRKEPITLKIG